MPSVDSSTARFPPENYLIPHDFFPNPSNQTCALRVYSCSFTIAIIIDESNFPSLFYRSTRISRGHREIKRYWDEKTIDNPVPL